jgi:hypothetical protein
MSKFKIGDNAECVNIDTFGYEYISLKSVYKIVDLEGNYILIKNNMGNTIWYQSQCFKLKEEEKTMNIQEQIINAQKYLGKSNLRKKDGQALSFAPASIEIIFNKSALTSFGVDDYLSKNDFCITLRNGSSCYPVEWVSLPPAEVIVALNASYSAIVTKETIKVGCQVFPIDILDKLVAAQKELA